MNSLSTFQHAFHDAIQDPALLPPGEVRGGKRAIRRFNVYRNNVYAGLIGVLETRFAATMKIVGDEFFRAMSRLYIDKYPPSSPVLIEFGSTFPDFIERFEYAQDVPYLADVSRIEWFVHQAYHAADTLKIAPHDLAAIAPNELAKLRLKLSPSVAFVNSRFPAFSLWRANAGPAGQTAIGHIDQAEAAFISRPILDVEVVRLPPGGYTFVSALARGVPLQQSVNAALENTDHFKLDVMLAVLLQQGALQSFEIRT